MLRKIIAVIVQYPATLAEDHIAPTDTLKSIVVTSADVNLIVFT